MNDKQFTIILTILFISFIVGLITFSTAAYGESDYGDEIVDDISNQVKSGIKSIEIGENPVGANQEEVNNVAESLSKWIKSLFSFGRDTHHLTEDVMLVVSPDFVPAIIIAVIAGGIILIIMIKTIKKVGLHLLIALSVLASVVVFLMLLDLLS